MKYKLELDFQFSRFMVFSLLALVITSFYTSFGFYIALGKLNTFVWIPMIFGSFLEIILIYFVFHFLRTYTSLREKLE